MVAERIEQTEPGAVSWIWALAPLLLGVPAGPCFLYAARRTRSATLAIEGVAYSLATVFYLVATGTAKRHSGLASLGGLVALLVGVVALSRALAVRETVFSIRRLRVEEVPQFADDEADLERTAVEHHLDATFALDRDIARNLTVARWGFGEVGKAFFWLVAVIGVLDGLASIASLSVGLGNMLGESSFGVAVWLSSRRARRASGGWRAMFGWSLPRLRDADRVAGWIGLQFLGRLVVGGVLLAALPSLRHHPVSNTTGLRATHGISLALLVIAVVFLAPVVEELFFRGLLLRAAMRRFSFWPAAVLSSVLFGAGHGPEAQSLVGAVALSVEMTTFGLIQCLLVRRAGRLGPAIGVHAVANALAVIATLA